MKKHLKLLLCLLTLACCLCVSVQAEEAEPAWAAAGEMQIKIVEKIDISEAQRLAEAQNAQAPVSEENWEAAKRVLKQGMQEMRAGINISRYGIPEASLMKLYLEVAYDSPELFYVRTGYSCSFNSSSADQNVYRVSPMYTLDGIDIVYQLTDENKQKIRQQQAILEQKLTEIMQEVRSDWSDLTKIMYLHDYLAVHCEYDHSFKFYDAYRMLIDGTSVCQGYTLAYRLLLDRAGVTSSWVSSDTLDHIWSLVRIDGSWYHVDVTWDDLDWFGKTGRTYFCISDEKMRSDELQHLDEDDWVYGVDMGEANKKYDDYYWSDLESPLAVVGENLYYLNGKQIMQTRDPEYPGTVKKTIDEVWYIWGSNGYYGDCYSGLSSYNGKLVYNTPDKIYSYDPMTGREQVLYTRTSEEQQTGYIYGSMVNGNVLQYVLAKRPWQSDAKYVSIQLDPYTTVAAGGYACYVKNGTLYLKRSGVQKGSVLAAWYDVNGKMLGMRLLNQQELTIPVPGAKTVKVFAVAETSYKPLCEATVLLAS